MTESEVLEVRIGDEHITPEQIMDVNIGTYGPGDYVLPTGQKLEAQLLSNNSIRIFDGAMVYCGVRDVIAVNNYHDVTIENGQQGMNRNDIIVRHFAKNEETQFGGAEFQVIKGTATSGDATDPEITDTDLRAGALTHDMKIYRARLEGLNVVAVEPLFEVLPSIPELNGKISSPYNLANCAFRKINKVVNGSGSSRQLFTLSELNSIFGVSADRQGYDLFLWNGDGTNEVHIDGATYTPNNTTFYATLDRTYTGSIRIRGIVIYNPSTDGAIT